ncbi:hypothetical protein HHK36_016008 [Tetracentron sinense]|uniref:Transcription elongation factor n=1 Tax=Tetracentron sinense TaxID=13715 RepID=A0A834Z4H7_TETSI|nr:hypothetical protein HHK36_016008 [Tetracentron sinense]
MEIVHSLRLCNSMEKELIELFDAAKKAADAAAADGASSSGSEESRCLDALKQLNNFPVTHQVLVSTQVGKRLRHLTKHPRKKIQAVASNLLDKWKNIVIEETTRNKKNGNLENGSSAKVEVTKAETIKIEKVSKTDSVKVEKLSEAETVKTEKIEQGESIKFEKVSRSEIVKVEKVQTLRVEKIPKEEKQSSGIKRSSQAPIGPPKLTSMVKCNDAMRDKVRELLSEAFSKVSSEADEDIRDEANACDPIRVAVTVESAMFEKWGRSNGAQKFKYRSIMFNIKDPNNPDLRRKVLLGHVKPERLLSMTPDEMASDQRQRENNQIKEKALFDCERGGQAKATTDQFRCGRCGQRKCTYYQMQTRSADEPMTTYVTCVNCNNHWKFC